MGKKFIRGVKEVVTCTSKSIDDWEMESSGARIVCEDPRLSIPCFGKEYKAINLKLCNRDVSVTEESELNFVLDLAAAAMDIENAQTKGPAERRIREKMLASEGFARARKALRGRT